MLQSIFLRSGCALPDRADPPTEHFCHNWDHVEKIAASDVDIMVRREGWHFMWVQRSSSRLGCGRTEANAINRAIARALRGIARQFNAAEFDALRIVRFAGFYVANVTMRARHIQQNSSLEMAQSPR